MAGRRRLGFAQQLLGGAQPKIILTISDPAVLVQTVPIEWNSSVPVAVQLLR